jgi:hypothetical protein
MFEIEFEVSILIRQLFSMTARLCKRGVVLQGDLFFGSAGACRRLAPPRRMPQNPSSTPAVTISRRTHMVSDLFQEWRVADRAAFLAEKDVLADSLRSIEGSGEPPAFEKVDRAKALRATANLLFEDAMAEMSARSLALRR